MTTVSSVAAPVRPARTVPSATLVLLTVLAAFVATGWTEADATTELDGDDAAAVDLVYRSAQAPRSVSYAGTQYVSAWSSLDPTAASASAVMTVEHHAGGRTRVSVPNQQASILEWRDRASWLAGSGGSAELLVSAYDVVVAGVGTVAGRAAVVVEARRDDGSVAARLWLDGESALALRRETFDENGALLNAGAFVDVEVTVGAPRESTTGSVDSTSSNAGPTTRPAGTALDWSDIEALRDSGWHCPESLSGGLALYEAHRYDDVVRLSYSDGVMTVSVFEQPGRLDGGALEGYQKVEFDGGVVYAAVGPPARYMWSSGGQVVTVVSEAPASVLSDLMATMPPETAPEPRASEPDDGILARIVRGAKKVGSFLNPFD